jgi:hypothetical protein
VGLKIGPHKLNVRREECCHLTRRGKKDFLLAIKTSFSVEKPAVVKNYTLQFSSKELALDQNNAQH